MTNRDPGNLPTFGQARPEASVFKRVRLEIFQRDKLQGRRMCCLQIDRWRDAAFERVHPSSHAQTPSISRFQPRKSPFRMRRHEVIAVENGKVEEVARDFHANRVQARVFGAGATKPVPVESC